MKRMGFFCFNNNRSMLDRFNYILQQSKRIDNDFEITLNIEKFMFFGQVAFHLLGLYGFIILCIVERHTNTSLKS